jgi:hypothetical protein
LQSIYGTIFDYNWSWISKLLHSVWHIIGIWDSTYQDDPNIGLPLRSIL